MREVIEIKTNAMENMDTLLKCFVGGESGKSIRIWLVLFAPFGLHLGS